MTPDRVDPTRCEGLIIGLPVDPKRSLSNPKVKGINRPLFSRKPYVPEDKRLMDLTGSDPIIYEGDSHLLSVAPTGAGKGVSVIIPNLLYYGGPVVVFDPKGENYAVTAKRRREMGHKVIKLDPFGVFGEDGDGFNPFDILGIASSNVESDSQMLAELLSRTNRGQKEPFWDISATGLISGLIAHASTLEDESKRNLGTVWDWISSDDVSRNLAMILDTHGSQMNRMAYQEIAMFLQLPEKETRPSVLSTAQTYLRFLLAPNVCRTFGKSSFTMSEIIDGERVSVYMILPPDKLMSHASILKVWVGVLFRAITSRRTIPAKRTVFMLDECAQLGHFPYLESVITLCRGFGLQVWSFWQDLSQIRTNYERSWETMLNNCDVLQIFGAR
ncbi:MAG: type IV secretory system conjugative DNA transfer family protein, partial [Microcystis sp. M045S2]|uniref:type IV secretory system conjugative DNA transfer family protein n=1 Tax=Microcystis sp. M045S2 TaxID=2771167 RepID=UPI00258B4ECB